MSRNRGLDRCRSPFVGMQPQVALIPFAFYSQVLELERIRAGVFGPVEQTDHIVAARHLSVPDFIVHVAQFVRQGFPYEFIGVKLQQLGDIGMNPAVERTYQLLEIDGKAVCRVKTATSKPSITNCPNTFFVKVLDADNFRCFGDKT